MKKIIIVKAGSTFAETAAKYGDFDEMVSRGLDVEQDLVRVVDASRGELLPEPADCCAVLITGAHCMVTDNLPWSLAIEGWIPELVKARIPLLGICYGHQLLGRAMGGQVDFHPGGKEVGTVTVKVHPESSDDPLFGPLPGSFKAHATHAQSVLTLPPGAVLLAGNDFEPHHAFRVGCCAWGVQFHPEYNRSVMRDYLNAQADGLARSGQDVSVLLENLKETPLANKILAAFARLQPFTEEERL